MSDNTQARFGWWLAAAAAVAAAAWSVVPAPQESPRLVRPVQPWKLPPLPAAADLSNAAGLVAQSPLWGKKVVASAPQQVTEDTRWMISGSYVVDGSVTAVIRFASGRPVMLVREGERLPTGETVVEVAINRVCFAAAGKRECRPVVPIKPSEF